MVQATQVVSDNIKEWEKQAMFNACIYNDVHSVLIK